MTSVMPIWIKSKIYPKMKLGIFVLYKMEKYFPVQNKIILKDWSKENSMDAKIY